MNIFPFVVHAFTRERFRVIDHDYVNDKTYLTNSSEKKEVISRSDWNNFTIPSRKEAEEYFNLHY